MPRNSKSPALNLGGPYPIRILSFEAPADKLVVPGTKSSSPARGDRSEQTVNCNSQKPVVIKHAYLSSDDCGPGACQPGRGRAAGRRRGRCSPLGGGHHPQRSQLWCVTQRPGQDFWPGGWHRVLLQISLLAGSVRSVCVTTRQHRITLSGERQALASGLPSLVAHVPFCSTMVCAMAGKLATHTLSGGKRQETLGCLLPPGVIMMMTQPATTASAQCQCTGLDGLVTSCINSCGRFWTSASLIRCTFDAAGMRWCSLPVACDALVLLLTPVRGDGTVGCRRSW